MFIEVTDPVKITQLLRAGLMWYQHDGVYKHAYIGEECVDRSDAYYHEAYAQCMRDSGARYGYMVEE